MRAALLLLVASACRFGFDLSGGHDGDGGSDGMAPPPFERYWKNGTRLRAITLTGTDAGDPIWIAWHDTMLDTTCRIRTAADGVERCVPDEIDAETYYADAGCTMPLGLARASVCMLDNKYASGRDTMGRYHAYPVGAAYTGTVYDARQSCAQATPTVNETVYSLGAEVPATSFVASQYTQEAFGPYEKTFQGAVDGAALEIGSLEVGGGPCYPEARALGPAGCKPSDAPKVEPVFSDMACTQRAYFWDRFSYDPPDVPMVAVYDPQACATTYRLMTTTANITGPRFYRDSGTGCMQVPMPAEGRLYTATNLASDPYPVGDIVAEPRRGRLGWLSWRTTDGQIAMRYYDHDLGVPCNPFVATDGKLRCLPAKPERFTAFPNPSCAGTTSTLVASCFPGASMEGPNYVSCQSIPWVVRSMPALGDTASLDIDGTCTPIVATGFYDPATAGATIDPTMFAELVEVLD